MRVSVLLLVVLSVAILGRSVSAASKSFLCKVCTKIVEKLREDIVANRSFTDVEKVVEDVCSFFEIEKKPVCVGIVREFRGEIIGVLKDGVFNDTVACAHLSDGHCGTEYVSDWTVPIPPGKPAFVPPQLPKPGSPVARVVHLTDLHVDLLYKPGTNALCGMPLCCREVNGPGDAGKWGDVKCDAPIILLENLFKHLAENVSMDYLIMTGDLPAHNVWNQSRTDQLHVLSVITDLLLKYLPHVTVYPSLGNHESAPVDSFPPPFIEGPQSNQWLLDGLAESWQHWLPEESLKTIRYGGYYAVRRPDGLRIISLNFNYCNNLNFWLVINGTDPAGQLHWLIEQLLDAERNAEKVHILGHIPPGDSGCIEPWSKNYNLIVDRFQNTIAAQFFGHTHNDELEVFFDKQSPDKHASSVAFISPSVTTYQGYFPTYRVYEIDGDYRNSTHTVLDHHNFWMNLTKANIGDEPTWELEYSAQASYKMASLFPHDWADLAKRSKEDNELFEKYYRHKYHGPSPKHCNSSCRKKEICAMLTSQSKDTSQC